MRCEPADLSKVSLDQFLDDALLQANSERLGLIYSVLTADEHNRVRGVCTSVKKLANDGADDASLARPPPRGTKPAPLAYSLRSATLAI